MPRERRRLPQRESRLLPRALRRPRRQEADGGDATGPSGLHPWLDVLVRITRAPVVTIADIRGRARGAGSEFALACDMRFASLESAILGQFEVGVGAVPGGEPMVRLAGLMGRGRAMEVVLGADDFPTPLAERYGYVNRAVPDASWPRSSMTWRNAWPASRSMRSSTPRRCSTLRRCRRMQPFRRPWRPSSSRSPVPARRRAWQGCWPKVFSGEPPSSSPSGKQWPGDRGRRSPAGDGLLNARCGPI